jgi:putative AlgH/UPF0301 family transcriptional regulator
MIMRIAGILAAVVVVALVTGADRAVDLSHTVMLVASGHLDGSRFEHAVVIAAPMPDGGPGHMGFIVNRPTSVKLEALFPDEAPPHNVKESVYLGGTALLRVFALMRSAPQGAATAIPLMPGVVAILDEATINYVIGNTPNAARYFVGMMLWDTNELERQVADGLWEVRPADADKVFRAKTQSLWTSLRTPTVSAPVSPF